MNKIEINYKITIYDEKCDIKILNNLHDTFDSNTLFPDMIDTLVTKNNIQHFQVYVENLKSNTWGQKVHEELCNQMEGDDFHYKWLLYKIKDIQNFFNLFDSEINIVIDGPGIGRFIGEKEGIKFYINNKEKDRHRFEPHIHCKYSSEEMRVRIDTLKIMKNDKPFKNKTKVRKAINWIQKHKKPLLDFYNSFAINEDNEINFEINI